MSTGGPPILNRALYRKQPVLRPHVMGRDVMPLANLCSWTVAPMLDFNSFMSRWKPVTFEESLTFVKKVKARDYRLYVSLFDIVSRNEEMTPDMYHDLLLLFESHDDLQKELLRFKPLVVECTTTDHIVSGVVLLLVLILFLNLFLLFVKYVFRQVFGT
ncbi:hypothetical protein OPV22_009194 [Ensete ventricosum]|uniref:Uncharacterized protein n=1 Tax=Ensete ventricosum TaxID=4639 RepID=A0AAV8RDX6_ENSVE|nr:hypothetical protein OPV22_009194 [Ensete ventricosum]